MTVLGALTLTAGALQAQDALTLGADVRFYGDDTEFSNPFSDGDTLFGTASRLFVDADLNNNVTVRAGVFANLRFGSNEAFELVRPVLSLILSSGPSQFIFGTLETQRDEDGPGPDREGPHGLLPPIQNERFSFLRPYEAGLQWLVQSGELRQDAWVNWQRLNTPDHRERFDAGIVGRIELRAPFALSYQTHIVHEGGQTFDTGPVNDSLAVGPGLIIEGPYRQLDVATVELHALYSRYEPDRAQPDRTRSGLGGFLRLAAEKAGWRGHLVFWRACDYIKAEGDPNYGAIRQDGSRFRNIRDYAEAGLTKTVRPASEVEVAAAARLHRIENNYDYSVRILATVDLAVAIPLP